MPQPRRCARRAGAHTTEYYEETSRPAAPGVLARQKTVQSEAPVSQTIRAAAPAASPLPAFPGIRKKPPAIHYGAITVYTDMHKQVWRLNRMPGTGKASGPY